jgi:hypothetical protein
LVEKSNVSPSIYGESSILKNTQKVDKVIENAIVKNRRWLVVGDSIIGKSHIENNMPCQDYNHYEVINDIWGIAISCDGAGSASRSDAGSKFVSQKSAEVFKKIMALTLNRTDD